MSSVFTTQANSLLRRLQRGLSAFELIHIPHEGWPNRHPRFGASPRRHGLRISVLDSSFNPPTLAHLALANSTLPPHSEPSAAPDLGTITGTGGGGYPDYDAKLLLLSLENADKSPKPTDATYLQRLQMMALLAQDIAAPPDVDSENAANVAVGVINEPTFVGKSRTLLDFLRQRLADRPSASSEAHVPASPQLTFLLGFDTLVRLLSPRYYESEPVMRQSLCHFFSSEGDNSRIVCARRVSPAAGPGQEESQNKVMAVAKEFIASGRVALVDIGEDEQSFSSSEVREKIIQEDEGWRRLVSDSVANYVVQQKLYDVTGLHAH